jgi:CubicO group peptidase (beta-lactamase class C family)
MKKGCLLLIRLTKGVLWFILAVFVVLNLWVLLSGKLYIYNGIRYTYLRGKSGPGIYDLSLFAKRKINKSRDVTVLPHSEAYNSVTLNEHEESIHKELDTKAFIVLKNDSIWYERYYDKHTPQTVSNSFSAAKTIVGFLIAIAVDEGAIKSLDEPVGNYLSAFKNGPKSTITIRHLLMMASGLDWEESGSNPLSENAESYYGWDLKGLINRQQLVTTPGKTFNYQSGNSQMLGMILEKATGKSVSEYTQEKIWKKIGAEHAAYWSLDKTNGTEKSFCCVYATARDFARLGLLLHQSGKWGDTQVVPNWYMNELTKPIKMATSDGIPNYRYSLHVWNYVEPMETITYCRGLMGQYIISMPKEDVVVVRLGSKRKDNIEMPENRTKELTSQYMKKVGHPAELFDYIRMARTITQK